MAKSNGRTQRPQRTSRNSSKAKVETKAQSNDDVEDPQTVQAEDPKDERLDGDLLDLDDSSDASDVVADDADADEKSTAATTAADKKSAPKSVGAGAKKVDAKDSDTSADLDADDAVDVDDSDADEADAADADDSAEDSKTATKSEKSAKAAKVDKHEKDSKSSKKKNESSKTAAKGSSAKGSSAKRTSRSGNPAKRPQGRKTASYTSQSGQQTIKPNPRWFLPVLIGLLLIGLVWLVTFYISQGAFPVEAWGNWNILIGFAFFVAGLIMSTRWR